MSRRSRLLLPTVIAVSAAALSAHAQTSKGILAGVARDATGAVIPGATIKVSNLSTLR